MPEDKTAGPIRVMIVNDHLVVRDGIRLSLNSFEGITIVAEAETGEQALQLCPEARPDAILMDLAVPETDGAAALRQIATLYPQVRIIALNGSENPRVAEEALQAGALMCLPMTVAISQLVSAILSNGNRREV